jgi:SAM-dependent methyltransferase
MRSEDFELLYNLEESYWWFRAMRRITDSFLSEALRGEGLRMLDAGCGTGFNLGHYSQVHRGDVVGFDITADAIEWVRRRGFLKIAQASVTEIPFASDAFDIVFSFDVLSQIHPEAISTAVTEMHRVLRPGGFLFVRAPAFEWLRSSHDEELSTQHRFNLPELAAVLRGAGFKVRRGAYANTFLFPIAATRRLLKRAGLGHGTDVKPLPAALKWLDPIFHGILSAEAFVLKSGFGLPFGLSVLAYAEKGADGVDDPFNVGVR